MKRRWAMISVRGVTRAAVVAAATVLLAAGAVPGMAAVSSVSTSGLWTTKGRRVVNVTKRWWAVTAGFLAVLACATWAQAAILIDQSYASQLPSQQGWTYQGGSSATNELDRMSISGGALTYNTIGDPWQTYGYYRIDSPGSGWGQGFTMSIRLKVTQSEQTWPYPWTGLLNPFGCYFGVGNGSETMGWGVATNYVARYHEDYQQAPLAGAMDNATDFHTYRVDGTFGAGGGWSMYRDDVLLGSGPWGAGSQNSVLFGDGSTGANAAAQISDFSLSSPIPEPATLSLLALGGLVALVRRRRQK
jgi:hypothetical protein